MRAGVVVLLAGAAAAVALVAGVGDDPQPVAALAPVELPRPPAAAALAKDAERARLAGGEIGALLDRVRAADALDLRLGDVRRSGVLLSDVTVRKRAGRAAAEATVREADIAAALPGDTELRHDPRARGPGVVFRGRTSLLGASVPVSARVLPDDGAVVVDPENLPIGRTTVFSDPRVRVERVTARAAPGGLRLRVEATFP
jgi:hypothetical protein